MIRWMGVFLLLVASLQAEIVSVSNLEVFEQEIRGVDRETLVLFDVDSTLIVAKDRVLRPASREIRDQCIESVIKYVERADASFTIEELIGEVIATAKVELVDPKSVELVNDLLKRKVPTMALTFRWGGRVGRVESVEDLRIHELRELGFDFSEVFSQWGHLVLEDDPKVNFPAFKGGILFSSARPKGEILRRFLDEVRWAPKRVLFIDDKREYLEDVEEACEFLGISFLGFHYEAESLKEEPVEEGLARFQYEYLMKNGRWLSDEEANAVRGVSCIF